MRLIGYGGQGALALAVVGLMGLPALAEELECAGPFARDASEETLVEAFGGDKVVAEEIDGPEGSTLDATLVYPNDPARHLVVLWWDEEARARPASIIIEKESAWTAPGGIRLGTTLAEVEKINGARFTLSGFGWDYGGSAGFEHGALAELPGGCILNLAFDQDPLVMDESILGDEQFSSDNRAMRAAKPTVGRIIVGYAVE
jgi:hypothetical protein